MYSQRIFTGELDLVRTENIFKATLCCCFFPRKTDYEAVIPYLHWQELNYYDTLKYEKRVKSYLLGRFAAKQAVAALTGENTLTNISVKAGIFAHPVVLSRKLNVQVSITHCDDLGAAIAFPEAHPMGIDIERIDPNRRKVLRREITKSEEVHIYSCLFSYETGLTLLWTAKEALSKVLKTGLMTPFEVFEISKIESYKHYTISYYKNFTQYKVISFVIDNYMCSMVYPLKTKLCFDIQALQAKFAFLNSVYEKEESAASRMTIF